MRDAEERAAVAAAPQGAASARHIDLRHWCLVCFCMAVWWLASPYLGLSHDALYYAADAMRRSADFSALNSDIFFSAASQGNFSLFPRPYAWLGEAVGIHVAALALTAVARIFWLLTWALLCRAALAGPARTLAFCAVLILPTSYGGFNILAYAEAFATPRHWAEAFSLLALALSLQGRPWFSLCAVALATLIHPLMGLPACLFLVLALPPRRRNAILALGVLALGLGVVAAIGPLAQALKFYDADWFAIVAQRNPMVLPTSWDLDSSGKTLGLLLLWAGAALRLGGQPKLQRLAWAAWGGTVCLLSLWVAGALAHEVLLIQLQFNRCLWIAQILTPLCVVAALPRGLPWSRAERGALALTLAALLTDLWASALLAAVVLGLQVWQHRGGLRLNSGGAGEGSLLPARFPRHWELALLRGAYGILALVMLSRIARIPFNAQLYEMFWADPHPMLTALAAEASLVALVAGLLALALARLPWGGEVGVAAGVDRPRRQRHAIAAAARWALPLAMPLAALSFWLWQAQPRLGNDARWEAAIRHELPPGDTVYWDEGLAPTWILLGKAFYASPQQGAGALFAREPALELYRRLDRLDALHFDTLRNRSAAHQAEVRAPDDTDIRALCQDTALDTVMLRGDRATAPRHFSWPGRPTISIFECRLLRQPATQQ